MTTTKKTSTSQSNMTSYLLAFIVGAGVVYFAYPYLYPRVDATTVATTTNITTVLPYTTGDAKVGKVNGLYVFIESKPAVDTSYTSIETFEGERFADLVSDLGIGREKLKDVLENVLEKVSENVTLSAQIEKMTIMVKKEYPEAEGVIFSERLRKCEVISFK